MRSLRSFDPRELYVFIVEEPMLAHFFMRSEVHEEDDFPAPAGVCIKRGRIHLYLNPGMMSEFLPNEKIGVLVHEYLHILMLHCSNRLSSANSKDAARHKKENIAMDMAINQLIRKSFDLPENCIQYDKDPFNYPADLTAEQYYELIEKQFSDQEIMEMDVEFDDHSMWEDGNTLEGKSLVKQLAKSYAQTRNGSDQGKTLQSAGNQYGQLLEKLVAIETYEINWQLMARKFLHSLLDDKRRYTYKRFSRRHGFPNPGEKFKTKARVAAIVDTSGSMSSGWLSHIGGQLNLMSKIMQVDVFFCDADVQGKVKKYRPSPSLEIPGRGGTNMQPAFDLANEENYRGVICFTDGYFYEDVSSKLPTMWVICNNESYVPPFGTTSYVHWRD